MISQTGNAFLLAAAMLAACTICAQQAGTSPVKVFVLAGQSNMLGQGNMSPDTTQGTLEHIVANDPGGDYQFLVDTGGVWVVRDDAWIRDQNEAYGGLTAGYGSSGTTIGPELGFGHAAGDLYENQVLIVKAAWGGKSLAVDFRPPSSGGTTGFYYNEVLRLVDDAVTNLASFFPDYDGQGYEIAGFGWHQGWNDRVSAPYSAEYETNMVNFIKDMRTDLSAPGMPFVIATTGMDGQQTYTTVEQAQLAMADPVAYPEFDGNVAVIDTRTSYEGLEFWIPTDFSPADQGYHWNRNAKTYLHIGLAMADAMSVMVPDRCPYRIRAAGDASGINLTWQNGTETPASVQVLRNSVEIAAAAPVTPPAFLDTTAEPGVHDYELVFAMPVTPCDALTTTFNAGITDLRALRIPAGIILTWSNNLGYSAIEIQRDSVVIEPALAGALTTYTDTNPPASGLITYSVTPTNGTAIPANVQINLTGIGNALVYEPFDDADPTLNVNTPGIGLSGLWVAGGQAVTNGSLTYGSLPTSGNRVRNVSGGLQYSSVLLGPELAAAGLMDHGSELWFSFLANNPAGVNTAVELVLGTERVAFYDGMRDGGEAIGVWLSRGEKAYAATWSPMRSAGSAPPASDDIPSDTTALVVGKIVWGASAGASDTLEVYLPGTDLELPVTPLSTASAVLDQSQFDTIAFDGKSGAAPQLDEIRFGVSYNDVIGADLMGPDTIPPTPDPMTWASLPAAQSSSTIAMTASAATDPSGVEYFFDCLTAGGHDSGWQDSVQYTDTGLLPGTEYTYRVRARDKSAGTNATANSSAEAATTHEDFSRLPFREPFEERDLGPLDGQYGWVASGAVVQGDITYSGSARACAITDLGGDVSHAFSGGHTSVWIDVQMQIVYSPSAPVPEADRTVAFYVATNGQVMAYDGSTPVSVGRTVGEGQWVRLTVFVDYTTKTWDLYVAGTPAGRYGFFNPGVANFDECRVYGEATYLDDLSITTTRPVLGYPTMILVK